MLRAIWRSLQDLFGLVGQGWLDLEGGQDPDLGHGMDPNGWTAVTVGLTCANTEGPTDLAWPLPHDIAVETPQSSTTSGRAATAAGASPHGRWVHHRLCRKRVRQRPTTIPRACCRRWWYLLTSADDAPHPEKSPYIPRQRPTSRDDGPHPETTPYIPRRRATSADDGPCLEKSPYIPRRRGDVSESTTMSRSPEKSVTRYLIRSGAGSQTAAGRADAGLHGPTARPGSSGVS